MSQSAVSRQVSALERELKVALFHRHARGLVLTQEGEVLFRAAAEVFNKVQTAVAALADNRNTPTGDLRVTTAVGLGSARLGWARLGSAGLGWAALGAPRRPTFTAIALRDQPAFRRGPSFFSA